MCDSTICCCNDPESQGVKAKANKGAAYPAADGGACLNVHRQQGDAPPRRTGRWAHVHPSCAGPPADLPAISETHCSCAAKPAGRPALPAHGIPMLQRAPQVAFRGVLQRHRGLNSCVAHAAQSPSLVYQPWAALLREAALDIPAPHTTHHTPGHEVAARGCSLAGGLVARCRRRHRHRLPAALGGAHQVMLGGSRLMMQVLLDAMFASMPLPSCLLQPGSDETWLSLECCVGHLLFCSLPCWPPQLEAAGAAVPPLPHRCRV